jgi:hypothetical protein
MLDGFWVGDEQSICLHSVCCEKHKDGREAGEKELLQGFLSAG